jgi:large subunit ribosomal protein L10Ae
MSSKVTNANMLAVTDSIKTMRERAKARKFTQTAELQVALKDYDP